MSEKHIGKVIQVIGRCWTSSSRMESCRTCSTPSEIDNHGQKLVVEVAAADR